MAMTASGPLPSPLALPVRLAVLTPAFTADCLETLEEIGIRERASFLAAGGEELRLVPCVNAHPSWVAGLAELVRGRAGGALPGS